MTCGCMLYQMNVFMPCHAGVPFVVLCRATQCLLDINEVVVHQHQIALEKDVLNDALQREQ